MAVLDISKTQYIKTVDTGEEIRMGSFKTVKSGELRFIRITMYWIGKIPDTEQVRVNIYSDSGYDSLLYQSDWRDLGDITGATSEYFAYVRCDFDRVNLNKENTYYIAAEYNNYTRNGSTYYQALVYDFPFPKNDNSEEIFFDHPLQFEIYHYVPRSS